MRWAAAAALLTVAVATAAFSWRAESSLREQVAAERQTISRLEARINALEGRPSGDPDWAAVAATVEPSVVTIETGNELGSGWVARSNASGADVVTNFHVVADAFSDGTAEVDVKQGDRIISGTVVRVDRNDDLALVHVAEHLPALVSVVARPRLGSTVMAVGSPLGLGGSVSVGVVSGFRSLEGSDYLQFSAPISPGNSGGPVVDTQGRVVAVASAKFVGDGVEALSLAIPVSVVCGNLVACA